MPALGPGTGDLVVPQAATESLYATSLADLLRERHIDTVVLGGLASDYCIDATARSAISHRFNVHLLADGHTTVSSSHTELSAPQIVAHHNRVLAGAIHPGGSSGSSPVQRLSSALLSTTRVANRAEAIGSRSAIGTQAGSGENRHHREAGEGACLVPHAGGYRLGPQGCIELVCLASKA